MDNSLLYSYSRRCVLRDVSFISKARGIGKIPDQSRVPIMILADELFMLELWRPHRAHALSLFHMRANEHVGQSKSTEDPQGGPRSAIEQLPMLILGRL